MAAASRASPGAEPSSADGGWGLWLDGWVSGGSSLLGWKWISEKGTMGVLGVSAALC